MMRFWNYYNKRGQSKIFVFVIAAVVLLLIIGFGNYAIKSFELRKEQTSIIVAKTDLDAKLSQIRSTIGRLSTIEIDIKPYNDVCFVDYDKSSFPPTPISSNLAKSMIEDEERTSARNNVLLISDEDVEFFYIENLALEKKVVCLKAENGMLSIRAEGKGSSVWIGENK